MEEVSRALVDAHGGDATQALLALARAAGIAVAYLDRRCLELHYGRTLTEQEWDRIKPELTGYDEWLDNSGAAESISYFVTEVLPRRAGITFTGTET
jgi:hypothetical protein